MKAKSDEKAAKLAEEIASMKAAKVSLLRKLQDEAAKFRCAGNAACFCDAVWMTSSVS